MLRPEMEVDHKEAHIVFLCDTSGSMSGERITNMNAAISSALTATQSVVATLEHPVIDAIDISAIRFSDSADWHIAPCKLHQQFSWSNLQQPTGITNLGQAYKLLDKWLSSNGVIDTLIVVLITDGMPTDEPDTATLWVEEHSIAHNFERIAFALGSDAESRYLDDFVSNEDNLYVLRNEAMLNELLTRALTKAIKKIPGGQQRHH